MQSKTAYRFLVIRWSGMGDVVMTLPAVMWLRNRFPDCHITYLTDTAFASIIETSRVVDRVETFNRKGFKSTGTFFKTLLCLLGIVWRLRRSGFDHAFDLQGFGETAWLAYLSRAPIRIGRHKESFLRRKLYTHPIQGDWGGDHRSRYFHDAVTDAFDVDPAVEIGRPRLPRSTPRETDVHPLRIGLNVGASTESRRWSEQNFFQLAEHLTKKGNRVRIFVGPQEFFLLESVEKGGKAGNWELYHETDMASLIKALVECDLLVSNDTGPGHLAAALDVPVITLFSTGSPENVGPLAIRSRWFRNETDINEIQVTDVARACQDMIQSFES